MLYPDTKKITKLNKCCKDSDNLNYFHGDGVENEYYECSVCKKQFWVPIQIQRFWEDMEEIEEVEHENRIF